MTFTSSRFGANESASPPGWAALLAAALLAACSDAPPPPAQPAPPEVRVHTVQPHRVPMTATFSGRTAAFATAEIRPQVGGIVLERLFTEGTDVKAGQVLYRIDPSAARAGVASAEATLARAQATLASAREKSARYRELVAIEAVSREGADEAEAAFKQAQAEVAAARAALDTARLSLGYANVTSPIAGRIGRSSVSRGALVTAGQTTTLATVQQLDPIYVDATQSAADMIRVRREFEQGRMSIPGGTLPSATLQLEDGSTYRHSGKLLLAEALVDDTAGTVTLRAQFPNPQRELLPGMFVRMTLQGAVADAVLTVPQVAVSRDAKGNALVFVVDAAGKVEQRAIAATQAAGDQWVVDSGLQAGDRVVVEGLQKVRSGLTVKAVDASQASQAVQATAPAASAAAAASAAPTVAASAAGR